LDALQHNSDDANIQIKMIELHTH